MFQSVFSFLHVVIQSHKFLKWGGGAMPPPTINIGGAIAPLPPQWSLPCVVKVSIPQLPPSSSAGNHLSWVAFLYFQREV